MAACCFWASTVLWCSLSVTTHGVVEVLTTDELRNRLNLEAMQQVDWHERFFNRGEWLARPDIAVLRSYSDA